MTEDIYDIEKWRENYPFLGRIWESYEKFDKFVDGDGNKGVYNALCNVISGQTQTEKEKYNDFCKKLVRNLGPFADNPKNVGINSESCQILYQWVYYMTMKYGIPDNFIKKIFDDSNEILSSLKVSRMCPYYSYKEKIHDPTNIIKIFNLSIVMNDLVSILMQDKHENNCSCRKFISECTNTYKRMNREYCSGGKESDTNNVGTCFLLSTFSTTYELFIRTKPDLNSKLPSLTDDTMNDIISCESHKSRDELTGITPEVHEPDKPIKIDTNAVLGTMAGVSSLFALSYKFTPLGKWFSPRHLIDTVGSNNIGKQAEYELFHNEPEDGNISLDQKRYNVAYGQV